MIDRPALQARILRVIATHPGLCPRRKIDATAGARATLVAHALATLVRRGLVRVYSARDEIACESTYEVTPLVRHLCG
jgi:DNA-binding IclR family transcriptional regulator